MTSTAQHPFEALTPDLLLTAIESTGLVCDGRFLALNSYENRVYQIGIEGEDPVVVKFYRPERWSREQILEEHNFVYELLEDDLSVVAPRRDEEGKTLHEFAGFLFALYPRRGGRSPDLNEDTLQIIGRALGKMHSTGARSGFKSRLALNPERFCVESREFLLQQDFIPAELRPAYDTLSRDLIERVQQHWTGLGKTRQLRLHGDCHPGNILWRDELPHFVDFDDCMQGPAIQDLWMLLSGDREAQQLQLCELIDGYDTFGQFNPAELNLLETLRTMRLMHYSAWLARRWDDPAFPHSFTWFNTPRYWSDHILSLREQLSALDEPPLRLL